MSNTTLNELEHSVKVSQGRINISDGGRRGDLYVIQSRHEMPLSVNETHVDLKLVGESSRVEIELDGKELDELIDALHDIQEDYR